jgi:hypothetical protein
LELTEQQHEAVVSELSQERPELFQTVANSDQAPTIISTPDTDNTDEAMTIIREIRSASSDAPTTLFSPTSDSAPTQIYHPSNDSDKTIIGIGTSDAETQINQPSDEEVDTDQTQIGDPDFTKIKRPEE